MTKQTKTLAALAAALVVCGGAYAALPLLDQWPGGALLHQGGVRLAV